MPKAKFKRKGVDPGVLSLLEDGVVGVKQRKLLDNANSDVVTSRGSDGSILRLPEEMVCMILQHLPVITIARVEQSCKHLHTVIKQAKLWRKLLLNAIESEPGLADFIPEVECIDKSKHEDGKSDIYYKQLFAKLKRKIDQVWRSKDCGPNISRYYLTSFRTFWHCYTFTLSVPIGYSDRRKRSISCTTWLPLVSISLVSSAPTPQNLEVRLASCLVQGQGSQGRANRTKNT